jgi:hypothetical protein
MHKFNLVHNLDNLQRFTVTQTDPKVLLRSYNLFSLFRNGSASNNT